MEVKVQAPSSEVSQDFLQGMADRMSMSYFKYGLVAEAYPIHVDAIDSLTERLKKYRQTGNTEWLMDVANFAMIEYMYPAHDQAHYRPTDSDESPGRAITNPDKGKADSNTDLRVR